MKNKLPIVTITGRQNVGKSTLFNAIIKEKKAIVDAHPGLTRDILSFDVNYKSVSFSITDSPGLDLAHSSELSKPILENARQHLEKSSVIILLMESPAPDSFDLDLADIIRKLSIPTIIAVNKMDSNEKLESMINFYEVGFNDMIPISALHRKNINMLLDSVTEHLPERKSEIKPPDIKLSIVGRPNSGKSTLLNSFVGFERSVVSDIPGTTRDPVDDTFHFNGKKIEVIDTAGIRKKRNITGNVEFYSLTRTIEAINRSNVVIHMIDAEIGISETDKKISDEIIKAKKPMIIAINKWDAIEKDDKTFEQYKDRLIFKFFKAEDFPVISISAQNRQRIHKLLQTVEDLEERSKKRIETARLNKTLERIQSSGRLPQLGSKLKVYYGTQTETVPPQFKLFVNNAEFFKKDVIRFFEKEIQKEFNLKGIPVIIHIEGKEKKTKTGGKKK